jgi:hypothetical protein
LVAKIIDNALYVWQIRMQFAPILQNLCKKSGEDNIACASLTE